MYFFPLSLFKCIYLKNINTEMFCAYCLKPLFFAYYILSIFACELRYNLGITCKEINPKWNELSLEGLMLKLQYFVHLMQGAEKTLMMGKIQDRRRREQQRTRWLDGITDSMDMSLRKQWEMVKGRGDWHAAVHGVIVAKSQTWLSGWTTTDHM